jgi:putative ABC transport system permease protein
VLAASGLAHSDRVWEPELEHHLPRRVAEYFLIRRWQVAEGGPFSAEEVDASANGCLLGQTVVGYLFPDEDPRCKTIRVRDLPFKIVGVLQAKGYSAMGFDQDDFILIPYTTAQHKVKGVDWLDDVMCSAISPEAARPAQEQVALLLRERHHIFPGQADDFNIRSPEDTLKLQEQASQTFTLMLASIASVSLLVGGIGIMNIMLVSVTERTREIGVRMAVGASEHDVQVQFLTEAVLLSLLGGAIGVPFGIFSSKSISAILGWPTSVSIVAIGAAVLFSLGVGVFFGYYPAQKAARLDPIEALRYE